MGVLGSGNNANDNLLKYSPATMRLPEDGISAAGTAPTEETVTAIRPFPIAVRSIYIRAMRSWPSAPRRRHKARSYQWREL